MARDEAEEGYVGDAPPTLKICLFAGEKLQHSVFLQGDLLDPGLRTDHILTICQTAVTNSKKVTENTVTNSLNIDLIFAG